MELAYKQGCFIKMFARWIAFGVCIYLSVFGLKAYHSYQIQITSSSNLAAIQKSSLITQMHNKMLSITRIQLQILHASNEHETREQIWKISELISDYLVHYHQFQDITESSDTILLTQFKRGFDQWHSFNKNLLSYAHFVSYSGFNNTLNRIDLAFSQFDNKSEEVLLLIAQMKQDVDILEGLSN